MNFVFFGTPKFAAIVLEKLIEANLVPSALVCNPDEPIGRKKILTPPATKQLILAKKINIPVFQPKKLSEIKKELENINADVFIVAAYNKIISEEIINIPKFKTIGVHPSLLPKYRGPSPIQSAILNDDKKTGVDLFLIDKEIDHGPVLISAESEILESDNYETLENKLAELGAKLLIENLSGYLSDKIEKKEQDHSKATFTNKFLTKDGQVDLEKDSPKLIFNKIRALNPDPGVFSFIKTNSPAGEREKRVKFLEARLSNNELELLKVQPEGKKPMSFKDFKNGNL